MRLLLLLFLLLPVSLSCLLCPLSVPPRPRPLDQFKLPTLPKVNTDTMPQFCNLTELLPVGDSCRSGIANILCSADSLIDAYTNGCPGSEDEEQCSICEKSKVENFWVVRWFDSIGKPPHGISDGNYYWLGDYEMCHEINREGSFAGQYCWVRLEVPDSLVEAGCPQTDPLEIIYGVCAPISCKEHELENIAKAYAPYKAKVQCEHEQEMTWGATILFATLIAWKIFIWTMTILSEKGWGPQWFFKFNLGTNGKRTLSTKRFHDQNLHSIHGLIFCAYLWLIAGNVYNMMLPYIENVAFAFDEIKSPFAHLTNNYSYHVDGLIALTCFLSASLMYGHIKTFKEVCLVVLRATLRFWPVYAVLVLYMALLFPYASSGPMWIHGEIAHRCQQSWWKNLLFINNFFGAKDTCVDFGYAVSLMTYYFTMIALLCWLAKDYFRPIVYLCFGGIIVSIVYTFCIIFIYDLPPAPILTAEPIHREKMELLLNLVIISPLARLSPALIGMLFALLPDLKLDPAIRFLCTLLAGVSALFVAFFLFFFTTGSYQHPIFLALYGSIHRPIWAFSILTLAYIATHGTGLETVEAFLGWRLFSPCAKRIVPAIILSEPIILHFFSALHRPGYATHWSTVYTVVSAAALSLKFSLILDAFVGRPIRNIFTRDFHREVISEEVEDGIELEDKL